MTRLGMEDLLRLNQEILALAQARVPLATELTSAATELTGPAAELAQRLEERMQGGDSLDAALEAEGDALPKFYAALVRAGAKADHLPAALEAFSTAYARMIDLRRMLLAALVYPKSIVLLAWILVIVAARHLAPTYEWIGVTDRLSLGWLGGWEMTLALALLPVALLVVLAVWLRARTSPDILGKLTSHLRWLPGVRNVRRLTSHAAYCQVLELLVRQGTPLPEALPLAAAAAGEPKLAEASCLAAERIAAGEPFRSSDEVWQALPPLVRISLAISDSPQRLADHLRGAAHGYDLRARAAADRLSILYPALATALIGGAAVAVYAVVMLRPYFVSLQEIAVWYGSP